MMNKFNISLILLLLALGFCSLSSCKKESDETNVYKEASTDHATAEYLFEDIHKQVYEAVEQGKRDISGGKRSAGFILENCASVTITPFDLTSWPKQVTIDFGETNCQGSDGNYRRGILSVIATGWYRDSLSVFTITPDNFFINDYKLEGTKVITNQGHNELEEMLFTISVINGKVTRPDEVVIYWSSERTRRWVEGEYTAWPVWFDDVYLVEGNATGTTTHGKKFSINIVSPLRVELSCPWIVSGNLQVFPEGMLTRYLDYGNGGCDNLASVSVGNVSFVVKLP